MSTLVLCYSYSEVLFILSNIMSVAIQKLFKFYGSGMYTGKKCYLIGKKC